MGTSGLFGTTKHFDLGHNVTLEMVSIPAGTFLMGSPEDEDGNLGSECPQHEVEVSGFCIGKYAVTQAQWQAVAEGALVSRELRQAPSSFAGENRPVEMVSWYDATEFCTRLSEKTGHYFRLPSEAEWEYACRAGTTTPYHYGETLTPKFANCSSNFLTGVIKALAPGQKRTTPVGSYEANAYGLFDLHGNVWEWCADTWHENYFGAPPGGNPWIEGGQEEYRVVRGGSWGSGPKDCRSAYRFRDAPYFCCNDVGFRVACSLASGSY